MLTQTLCLVLISQNSIPERKTEAVMPGFAYWQCTNRLKNTSAFTFQSTIYRHRTDQPTLIYLTTVASHCPPAHSSLRVRRAMSNARLRADGTNFLQVPETLCVNRYHDLQYTAPRRVTCDSRQNGTSANTAMPTVTRNGLRGVYTHCQIK